MARIKVEAGKPYEVIIEKGALTKAAEYIASVTTSKKVAVITDDTVDSLYGDPFVCNLASAGFETVKFTFPHGEASKNTSTFIKIIDFLAENHLTRSDTVIALGGGVVGDISGFAAATYLRGIRYIQVPTTRLSAVDSSVGGKCAVDIPMGKNLLGAFHQPSVVICDYKTLDTLPREIFLDGCGEVLKYGILYSPDLLSHLSEKGTGFDREYVIGSCVQLKADVVKRDEFDTGERAMLNLGHTVAHAIEKLSNMTISHGAAVATGCAVIARASASAGICTKDTSDKICDAVLALGHKLSCEYSAKDLCNAMLSDKKRHGNTVDLIVVEDIGRCKILPISTDDLLAFIEKGLRA